jgi:modification methylase
VDSVGRREGHPAPFPEKLPGRLIRLYTYMDDVVLDPFVGTGTTCAVAKTMNRQWVGIDINPVFVEVADRRVAAATDPPELRIGTHWRPRNAEMAPGGKPKSEAELERKHRRGRFGLGVEVTSRARTER